MMKRYLPKIICLILLTVVIFSLAGMSEESKKEVVIQVVESTEAPETSFTEDDGIEIDDYPIPLAGAPEKTNPVIYFAIADALLAICYAGILVYRKLDLNKVQALVNKEIIHLRGKI